MIYNIDDKLARAYYLIYIARRIFYISMAWWFPNMPVIQVLALTFVQQAMLFYQSIVRPGRDRMLNNIDLFNEWMVLLCTQFVVVFSEW